MSARAVRRLLTAAASVVLLGCADRASFNGIALDPPEPAPALRVTDAAGQPFDLAAQRGAVTLLFFGYTHCPDVCPTTLADWVRVRAALGERAERVRFVFVSVDPERDTPDAAMAYARSFHPSFIGLAPPRAGLEALMRSFHLTAYETPPPDSTSDGYMVTHGTHSVIVDAEGRMRVLHPFGSTVRDVAEDVERLL